MTSMTHGIRIFIFHEFLYHLTNFACWKKLYFVDICHTIRANFRLKIVFERVKAATSLNINTHEIILWLFTPFGPTEHLKSSQNLQYLFIICPTSALRSKIVVLTIHFFYPNDRLISKLNNIKNCLSWFEVKKQKAQLSRLLLLIFCVNK